MSTDIQAPDLSLNVRYNKGDKKNGAAKEEGQVIIYECEDALKHRHADLWPHKFRRRIQNNLSAVCKRHFTIANILGMMYLLILAGIVMRYILAMLDKQNLEKERDQLSISLNQSRAMNINLTEVVHKQLQFMHNENKDALALLDKQNLVTERDQLSISLDQERDINRNLAEELHELQSRYDILGKNNNQSEVELKKAKDELTATLEKQNLMKGRDQLSISLDQARDINRNLAEELHELQSRHDILGKNKSQLQVELKKVNKELTDILATLDKQNLMKEKDQLSISLDQAQDINRNLAGELHELQSRHDICGKNNNQLEAELKKAKDELTATLDKQNTAKERDQLSISLDQARDINRNLAEELHELQSRYDILGKNKSRLEVELKKRKEDITDILATLDKQNLMKERDELSISLNQARDINRNLAEELHKLQSRYNTLDKNKSRLDAELKKRTEEITNIRATLDKQNLMKERDQLSISLDQARDINRNLAEELHELQSRYDILGKNKSRLEVELNNRREEITDIFATLDKQNLVKERNQICMSLNQAHATNRNLAEELNELRRRYDILGENNNRLEAELKKAKDESRDIFATLDKQNLVKERNQICMSLNQAHATNRNLAEELNELRRRYDILGENNNRLEAELKKAKDESRDIFTTLDKQNLVKERNQICMSLNQAHATNRNLAEELNELRRRYDILSKTTTG